MRILIGFFSLFFYCVTTNSQTLRGIKWSKSGNSYYAIENNSIVEYKLPSFERVVLIDTVKLKPGGKDKALSVRNFYFSEDIKKVLIYTNTKRVWRQDTRGDYWVLDLTNNSLK